MSVKQSSCITIVSRLNFYFKKFEVCVFIACLKLGVFKQSLGYEAFALQKLIDMCCASIDSLRVGHKNQL